MSLLKYALSANAYIFSQIPDNFLKSINNVILFGSVARGDYTKNSDVDIFYDVNLNKKDTSKLKRVIIHAIENFYTSNQGLLFRIKDVSNKLSVVVGDLKKWELKDEIVKYGILLYGKYIFSLKGEPYLLVWWDRVTTKNRGAFLNKLYGYTIKSKRYEGIIEKFDGIKVGKSAITIPLKHKEVLLKILKKYGVSFNQMLIST